MKSPVKPEFRFFGISILAILLSISLFYFYGSTLLSLKYVGIFFIALGVLYFVLANKKKTSRKILTKQTFLFFSKVILLQISFTLFFISMMTTLLSEIPFYNSFETLDKAKLLTEILTQLIEFQPWWLIACLSSALAFTHYNLKQPGLLSYVTKPLLKRHIDRPAGWTITYFSTQSFSFFISWISGYSIVLMASIFLEKMNFFFYHQINWITILITLLFFGILFDDHTNRFIRFLSGKKFSISNFLLLFIAVSVLLLFSLNVTMNLTEKYLSSTLPRILDTIVIIQPWPISIKLFSLFFYINASLFISTKIASWAESRSIREILLAAGLIPSLLITFFISKLADQKIAFYFIGHSGFFSLLSLFMAFLVLLSLRKIKNSSYTVLGLMKEHPKINQRHAITFMRSQYLSIAMAVILYLLNGVFFISVISCFIALPALVVFIFSLSIFAFSLWKHYEY